MDSPDPPLDEFRSWYGRSRAPVFDEIERTVLGSDHGGNGYTTRAQVDDLARRLGIGPRDHVLDIGTGAGWPAVYLARTTGCTILASDLPHDGLAVARDRAAEDGVTDRVSVVAASAEHLPLRARSFDVIVHTDVLC